QPGWHLARHRGHEPRRDRGRDRRPDRGAARAEERSGGKRRRARSHLCVGCRLEAPPGAPVRQRMITATRTYLEMRDPAALKPAPDPGPCVRVDRVLDCPPAFWRFLYTEVGRPYYWIDRLSWSDAEITAYLTDRAISLHLMTVSGAPAGYFELRRHQEGAV